MEFLILILIAFSTGCWGQTFFEEFNSKPNVLLSGYDDEDTSDAIQYAPADPNQQDTDEDGKLNTSRLIYSFERGQNVIREYRGLAASYELQKIWANNRISNRLEEITFENGETLVRTSAMAHLTTGLQSMAFDRITKILYWTSPSGKVIRALDLGYRHFTEIYRSTEVAPRALAVHPVKRKLFYSSYTISEDNFISKTELVKMDLDGSNPRTILRFPDVLKPSGLTIDLSDDKLFWTDANFFRQSAVVASDLDGRLKRQFFAKTGSFFLDIAHYSSYIYVTDWVPNKDETFDIHIRYLNGSGGIVRTSERRPASVVIYGPDPTARTKVANECDNSDCDHICLASSSGQSTCKCSPGFRLVSGTKCESRRLSDDYLLIADIGQKRLLQLPLLRDANEVGDIIAIDFDDVTGVWIYAASVDQKTGTYVWYDIDADEIVFGDNRIEFDEGAASITTDCCGKAVYWSSGSAIYSWDGRSLSYTTIYLLSFFANSKVRGIVIDCKTSLLYWVEYDIALEQSTLYRSTLGGQNVQTVLTGLPSTFALTIDYETYTLFVVTFTAGIIYSIPLNLLENSIPSTSVTYVGYTKLDIKANIVGQQFVAFFSATTVDGYVYLPEDETKRILRYRISTGPSSLEIYGGNEIFHAPSLSFYQRSFYRRYFEPICDPTTTTTFVTTRASLAIAPSPPSRPRPLSTTTSFSRPPPRADIKELLENACLDRLAKQIVNIDFGTALDEYFQCLKVAQALG